MKTILIIEDDKNYAGILQKKLKSEGFNILMAENGKKALSFLSEFPVDLIILDLLMPEMDGVTFLYHIRNTQFKTLPVIILTNLTSTVYPKGFNLKDFLVKANTSLDKVVEVVKKNT